MGSHLSGQKVRASVLNAETMTVCTSGSRPTPASGQVIFETDTQLVAVGNGTTFQYVPTEVAPPVVLSGTAASVNFTSIPACGNLMVVWRARNDSANPAVQLYVQFNSDGGNNYLWEINQANNTTVAATTSGAATTRIQMATMTAATSTANYFAAGSFTIAGASDTSAFKVVQGTAAAFVTATNMYSGTYSGQWLSTAAITSINITPASGNFTAGSRFTLLGWN